MLFESPAHAGVFDDPSLVDAISKGSRAAFARLFDVTADAVRTEVAARLPDAGQAAAVFAGTYVEVWWLAGCHSGSGTDVLEWIRNVLRRRIADARAHGTGLDPVVDRWPSHAEIELAALLGNEPKGHGRTQLTDLPVR